MADGLPRGSVTFVFTDIESSTRLLRRLGDVYPDVLDQHRRLLRAAWEDNGGVEVKTEADACFAAFSSADGALAGCVAAQEALARTPWPEAGQPRVRMGVHTGIAFPRDNDYISLAVHQAARVVQAAHGGQVLASEHTVGALVAPSSTGVGLATVGRYRLRDFEVPVELFQVGGGGADFPAVRAVPADHHNIVPARTSFIGRRREVATLAARLAPHKVVTICGAGGMGKTRLATEIGLRMAPVWRDGVWMVDLSPVTDPHHVVPAVASALGTSVTHADRQADVLEHLAGRRALIVLDNCEQVIEPCAAFVLGVLDHCPSVAVLATSREPLGLAGEDVHRLSPLPVDDDAVSLFLDRCGATDCADVERDAVARICRRLDGMPLAIELAASRRAVLSLAEIEAGLDERFRLLRNRDRAAPRRQRTMTALLDWSYELLSLEEQAVFERLSVFAGTFDLEAAAVACGRDDLDRYDVPELVWSLVDKSLVVVEPSANATRYRMLETIRAYAAGHLRSSGEAASTIRALAAWYIGRFPLDARGRRDWLSALAIEVDTMGGLIDALPADDPSMPALARLRAELRAVTGEPRLGWEEIDHVLARVTVPSAASARLVLFAASLLGDGGDVDRALRRCDQGEALLDRVGDLDRWGSVREASPRSTLLLRSGHADDLLEAEALAADAVAGATSESERADALLRLALARGALGREGVAELYNEVATLARCIGDHVLVALTLNNLVEEDLRRGLVPQAAAHQRESLAYAAELGMEHLTTFGLIAAARIAEDRGADALAIRLHALAERRLDQTGLQLFPDDQALSDAMLERTAARLGPAAYAAERRAGESMAIERALDEADGILALAAAGAPVTT